MKLAISIVCLLYLAVTALSSDFKAANRLFTADFYKEEKESASGNFLISPFSAEVVLALTQLGSKDQTAEELKTILHHPNDDSLKQSIRTFFSEFKTGSEFQFYSANKIYLKKNFSIKKDLKQTADVFKAEVENIDFGKEAVKSINQWVEKQTQNKIHNLVEAKNVGPGTIMVLINALYFKGSWVKEFKKDRTEKKDFYRSSTTVKVDMMHQTDHFAYYESQKLEAQFLRLPFKGSDASLVLVLPNDKNGLEKLETNLGEIFASHDFEREKVVLTLPKFKVESKVELKKILQKLGVGTMFGGEADLSGISGEKGDLVVGEVLQKTFFEADEEGVEAAAATFMDQVLMSAWNREPPKEFKADHPFIFYLEAKGVVLFAGRITDPSH